MIVASADGDGRLPSPQVDRRGIRPHLCTRRAVSRVRICGVSTRDAVGELAGQGPLASSPRSEVSPSPSCPHEFLPQHLTVASSCGEPQVRIRDVFGNGEVASIEAVRWASGGHILDVVICYGLQSRVQLFLQGMCWGDTAAAVTFSGCRDLKHFQQPTRK